jgi:hypothetical protein
MSNQKQFYWIAIVIVVLALSAKFYALFIAPPHWDDSYYLNIAINYQDNGLLTPRMWRLDADTNIIAGSGTGYGIYFPIIWYQVFGLNLLSGRIMMYLIALLILPIVYLTSRLWWGHIAGIVAVVFTALNPMFFYNYNLRMDAFGELAYSLVLLLHIYAIRSKRHYLHFFVGIAAILTVEIHILGVLYVFGLAFYYALDQARIILSTRRIHLKSSTIFYMAGAFIAGIVYLGVHILPNPEAYFTIASTCSNCTGRSLEKELLRVYELFYRAPVATSIFIIAVYGLARRISPRRAHYLILTLGTILTMILINPPAQFQYLAHFLPILAIGIGGFFYRYCKNVQSLSRLSIYVSAFIAILMLIPIGFQLSSNFSTPVHENSEISQEAVAYIHANIPHETVIVGPPFAYVNLIDYHNFMTIADGDEYGVYLRRESFDTFLEREAPQVIITEPYPNPQKHQAAIEALNRYVNSHDMIQVLPDLLVARELLE